MLFPGGEYCPTPNETRGCCRTRLSVWRRKHDKTVGDILSRACVSAHLFVSVRRLLFFVNSPGLFSATPFRRNVARKNPHRRRRTRRPESPADHLRASQVHGELRS